MNKSVALSLQSLKKKGERRQWENKIGGGRESIITTFKYIGLITTLYTEIVSFFVPQM